MTAYLLFPQLEHGPFETILPKMLPNTTGLAIAKVGRAVLT
jgi:hypothetical protein